MTGCHCLTCSAHSNCVTAPYSSHSHFSRSFIGRACKLHVYALLETYTTFFRTGADHLSQTSAVYLTHIRKSASQLLNVRSDQRTWNSCGNVIGDHHKIAWFKIRVHSTGCICKKQLLRPHHAHQPCGKNYIRHWIAFIVMHSSLHDHNRHIFHISKYKSAFVACNCGGWKTFNLCIVNGGFDLDLICIISKAGSQDQRHFRFKICPFSNTCKASL